MYRKMLKLADVILADFGPLKNGFGQTRRLIKLDKIFNLTTSKKS